MASTKKKQAQARAARRNSERQHPFADSTIVTLNLYGADKSYFQSFAVGNMNGSDGDDARADLYQQWSWLRDIEKEVRKRAANGQNANTVRLALIGQLVADLYINEWNSFRVDGVRCDTNMRGLMTGLIMSHAISHITDKPCDIIINMTVEKSDEPFPNGDEYIASLRDGSFIMLRDKNLDLLAHYGHTDDANYADMLAAKANPNGVH